MHFQDKYQQALATYQKDLEQTQVPHTLALANNHDGDLSKLTSNDNLSIEANVQASQVQSNDKQIVINKLLSKTNNPKKIADELGYRSIDTLLISPSQPIDEIAIRHIKKLPSPIKQFFGLNKQPVEGGISLASYLLFDGDFMNELIALGYKDAKKQAKELDVFFNTNC